MMHLRKQRATLLFSMLIAPTPPPSSEPGSTTLALRMCFYPPYVKPVVVEELVVTGPVWLSSPALHAGVPLEPERSHSFLWGEGGEARRHKILRDSAEELPAD